MGKIRYHMKEININGKLHPITLYSKGDIKRQKELYARYAPLFVEQTHSSVYSFIPGFSNFDSAAAASHYAFVFDYYIWIIDKDMDNLLKLTKSI